MADPWMDTYLYWILEQLNFGTRQGWVVRIDQLRRLHNMEFIWILDHDRRRALDGLTLRSKYPRFKEFDQVDHDRPCSVLEMLAALAIRMDKEWIGNARINKAYIPFKDMIQNLNLNEKNFYQNVNDWMYRRFGRNGEGSIFPLKRPIPGEDQRDIEIWNQMIRYINENY